MYDNELARLVELLDAVLIEATMGAGTPIALNSKGKGSADYEALAKYVSINVGTVAAKLREIAQQGKAGGVAEGWRFVRVADHIQIRLPNSEGFCEVMPSDGIIFRLAEAMLATPPAHSPEAGATDEMVERYCEAAYQSFSALNPMVKDHFRKAVRAGLTAALAPQPKDAT